MSEQSKRFEYLMEDRELARRAAEIQPVVEDRELRRQQAIAQVFAEKRKTSHDGVDPFYFFGEGGAAICEGFMARMAERDFPGSFQLENVRGTNSITKAFWQRLVGPPPPASPFKIRGYKIGEVAGVNDIDAYLCEDGSIRGYTTFFKAVIDEARDERCLVRDIPIDPVSCKTMPVIPLLRREGGVAHGLEEVLLSHVAAAEN